MKLSFKTNYKSIYNDIKPCLDEIIFPDFSVITGINGSGKTHFLKAIESNSIIINYNKVSNYGPKTYFNYSDFILSEKKFKEDLRQQRMRGARYPITNSKLQQSGGESNELIEIADKIQTFLSSFDSVFHNFLAQHQKSNESSVDHKIIERIKNSILNYLLTNRGCEITNLIKHIEKEYQKSFLESYGEPLKNILAQVATLLQNIDDQVWKTIFSYGCTIREVPALFKGSYREDYLGQSFLKRCKSYFINEANLLTNELGKAYFQSESNLNLEHEREKVRMRYGENPLKVFNKILREYSCNNYIFEESCNQSINNLVKMSQGQESINQWSFFPKLKNEKGLVVDIDSLSSGEKVLLAIASILLKNKQKQPNDLLSGILLLDEVDTNLHPSMIKNLLDVIQNVLVEKLKLKVFLVTHSPTTIALSPENSIFIMHRSEESFKRIEKRGKVEALETLTEGYATLEEGIKLFDSIGAKEICIFTEGKNTEYLRKAAEYCASDIEDRIEIITGVEGCSNIDQLVTIFNFFSKVPHEKKVVFVWDCDAQSKPNVKRLQSTENTIKYVFDRNKNTIIKNGIENLFNQSDFDKETFQSFYADKQRRDDGGRQEELKKEQFQDYVFNHSNKDLFRNFESLFQIIRGILK